MRNCAIGVTKRLVIQQPIEHGSCVLDKVYRVTAKEENTGEGKMGKTLTYDERYENLMVEILDLLENGDVALDFEDKPHMMPTIRIIANIVRDELAALDTVKTLWGAIAQYIDEEE